MRVRKKSPLLAMIRRLRLIFRDGEYPEDEYLDEDEEDDNDDSFGFTPFKQYLHLEPGNPSNYS
jgi:hypothetical protein